MRGEQLAWAYFDTSVLVKCYVEEQGRAEAVRLVGRYTVVSSALAPVELVGALRRQEEERWITKEQREHALSRFEVDRTRWMLLAIDAHVLARAESLAAARPVKALDALHLAAALVFRAETALRLPFITADSHQRRSAEALDLGVVFVG